MTRLQPAHVEREDGARLVDARLEAAGDVAAAAERDDHGVLGDRGIDDRLHLGLVGRVDHDIRGALDLVGADAHQVAQALAVGVHDALHRRRS